MTPCLSYQGTLHAHLQRLRIDLGARESILADALDAGLPAHIERVRRPNGGYFLW